jgi:hypothetical protein
MLEGLFEAILRVVSYCALSLVMICASIATISSTPTDRSRSCRAPRDFADLTWAISTNPHSKRSEDFGTDQLC